MASCRSCEALIEWAEMPSGKRMPLDQAPTTDGTFVFINGKARAATDEDRRLNRPLYKSHFSTCPNADQHRRSK